MTTYAGGCSVSVTLTPSPSGAATFAAGASVSFYVSPTPGGALFTTYEDENGQKQPIYLEEWYKGREYKQTGTTKSYTRIFHIVGTFETTDCLDIGPQVGDLDDVLPTFVVQSRSLKLYAKGGGGVKKTTNDMVELTVDYQEPLTPQSEGGDAEATYSLDFTSESEHVDQAIIQLTYGAQPEAGEEKLINFDGETVAGLDIDSPIMELTEEHVFTESDFSPAYREMLATSIKKTNNETWRGFDAGSVLLDGVSATKRGLRWYVSFRFRIRAGIALPKTFNIVDANGNPDTVTITKLGWEYLWFGLKKRPADGGTKFQIAPASVNIAQVYDTLDFSTLGIGILPLN